MSKEPPKYSKEAIRRFFDQINRCDRGMLTKFFVTLHKVIDDDKLEYDNEEARVYMALGLMEDLKQEKLTQWELEMVEELVRSTNKSRKMN